VPCGGNERGKMKSRVIGGSATCRGNLTADSLFPTTHVQVERQTRSISLSYGSQMDIINKQNM